ncbi:uncharacterized protein WM294_006419 isoform 2-T2 [Sarcoramphus papa]
MPREGSTGPAVPALGSREGAEVFLAQPPESWATKEAAAGVGKHLGMTLMIDVRCNLGQVTEHLMVFEDMPCIVRQTQGRKLCAQFCALLVYWKEKG